MSKEKHLIARQQLGLFFSERRKEMGHDRKALADFVGVSENTILKIEMGNFDYTIMLMFRICEALEIKPFFVPLEEQFEQKQVKVTKFEDAHAMSLMHGSTFQAPTNDQLQKLKLGKLVKINSCGERFWAKIQFIDFNNKDIIALVDNDLVNTNEHGLSLGDVVKFKFQNIYSIHED